MHSIRFDRAAADAGDGMESPRHSRDAVLGSPSVAAAGDVRASRHGKPKLPKTQPAVPMQIAPGNPLPVPPAASPISKEQQAVEAETSENALLGRLPANGLAPPRTAASFSCRLRIDYRPGGRIGEVTVQQGCGRVRTRRFDRASGVEVATAATRARCAGERQHRTRFPSVSACAFVLQPMRIRYC
jgi:hypothetical protein